MNALNATIRCFTKDKLSWLINITGLAIGLTSFTCIALYVEHELSFDKFHPGWENTVRVVKDFVNVDGASVPDATTPPALAKALRTELTGVVTATRFSRSGGRLFLMQYQDKTFYETRLINVDKEFFHVFDFPFIAGNRERCLEQIHSMLLTKSTAVKFFGDEDPIGKTIRMNLNGGTDYVVTGILEDISSNSHFTFHVVIPFESRRDADSDWQWSSFYTYVRLKGGSNTAAFLQDVQRIVKNHLPNALDEYHIQALSAIHLHSNLKWELSPNGDMGNLKILMLIGVLILIIACINYINLVTARSSDRAREVGVRKAVGALRSQLIRQFLMESALTVVVAMVLALVIASVVLPLLTPVTDADLSPLLFKSRVIKWSIPFAFLISFLAGFYPAIYLSGLQPLKTLRGRLIVGQHGIDLRRALVVFQFTLSSALIASTLIIAGQLDFMKTKDLGFNEDNIVLVPNVRAGIGGESTIKGSWDEKVKQLPGVVGIARADGILGANNSVNGVGSSSTNSHISLNFIRVDYDFMPTLEIELAEGRNFSRDFISDSSAIILNEEAVRQLGLQQPLLGQRVQWDDDAGQTHDVTLVGIAKDFHFTNLHQAISPFGFLLEVGNGSNFFIRTTPANLESTLGNIGKVWNQFNPGRPFSHTFQDQYLADLHMSDERFEKLFSAFTAIAIIIACLGLFGLTAFLAESRTKEVGIRKILGASVVSILELVSKDYVVMILVSLVLGFPLSYYCMTSWLQNFAYHINIGWQVFMVAGFISIVLALITISFHALKVATRNPIYSLRSE